MGNLKKRKGNNRTTRKFGRNGLTSLIIIFVVFGIVIIIVQFGRKRTGKPTWHGALAIVTVSLCKRFPLLPNHRPPRKAGEGDSRKWQPHKSKGENAQLKKIRVVQFPQGGGEKKGEGKW